MKTISNLFSIRSNGKLRPENWLPANWRSLSPEELFGPWGNEIGKQWEFNGSLYQITVQESGWKLIDPLPDRTGLLAMKDYHQPEAFVLNGDASIRLVLKPAFNMRGHDDARLALIRELDQKEAQRLFREAIPREEQVLFHERSEKKDVLEIFGDDGFGDCYYTYDSNTGELLSARTLPRRS